MTVKRFEIVEMIAKGGMAEVYRARRVGVQGFEKEICIKKILPHLTEDETFVTMFIDEAKLAATLSSANVVQVHDLCVSGNGEYFIVMEYVDGKDLADIIRTLQLEDRDVPPELAVHIAREICQGLAYAHTKKGFDGRPLQLVHRDISPHNVLVSRLGEVKLVDFGIAKASSSMTVTEVGVLKGKYGYMSPEQARGRPLDHRTDLFNTGIVLYELLVGERCFAGASEFSTLDLMRNAEVVPPTRLNPEVPASLERLVLWALALDPADRPQSALELEQALGAWARAEGAVAAKGDLATFMRGLMGSASIPPVPTGPAVIEVESVVRRAKPRPSTVPVPSLMQQPITPEPGPAGAEPSLEPMVVPRTASAPRGRPDARRPRPAPSRRPRWIRPALLAALAGLSGLGIGFAATARRAPAPVEAPAAIDGQLGLLVVESEPPGIPFEIDGRPSGHPTPHAVDVQRDAPPKVRFLEGDRILLETTPSFEETPLRILRPRLGGGEQGPPGRLRLALSAPAVVEVDGLARGRLRSETLELSSGSPHRLRLRWGRTVRTVELELGPGEERVLILGPGSS